jgi:HEAT repeats
MSRVGIPRPVRVLAAAALLAAWVGPRARAADDPAIARGVQFLRQRASGVGVGEMALAALALIKAEVPPNDPALTACLSGIGRRLDGAGYSPEREGGTDIYEAAVVGMVLANLEAQSRRGEIAKVAEYLIDKQRPNGSWDYNGRDAGDTSISQYAVLGLWEAANAGADVPPTVFDRAAHWYMDTQWADGGWSYHRDQPSYQPTVSMTAAGVGSLLICRRQIAQYLEYIRGESPSKLLIPINVKAARPRYELESAPARIDPAIRRGLAWLATNYKTTSSPAFGPSLYYGLYGLERIGALADRESLGGADWYETGRKAILAGEHPGGGWSATHGEVPNTAWAILFLSKSTAKTLRRIEIKRLGGGTLLGGRGLPKDLSSLTVAGGRVVSRPMNGAVEGMLSVLEDPRARDADSALAGLVARYQAEGPGVLRPHKDRFRKLLTDRDPGLRQVAAWALGRSGDLDAAPDLIGVLTDPDPGVVETARIGLQLLSRKIDGMGPPPGATPERRREAAAKWRDWYNGVRPLDLEGQDDEVPPRVSATADALAEPGGPDRRPR